MSKYREFFFNFEEIKARYVKEDKSVFFNSLLHSNSSNSFSSKGKNFGGGKKEVVIKLISNLNAIQSARCINYILKEDNQDVVLKNENGERIEKNILKEWNLSENEKSKECWHLMFSINEAKTKENFDKLESAVLETMRENFPNHSFAYAIHNHQNNPHIHLIMKKRNNLTKKKIHFAKKGEIAKLFSKMRDDFSMALNYKKFDYTATKKIERLDTLLDQYHKKEKNNSLSVDEYSRILLSQINFHSKNKEKLLENINSLKMEQKEIRDFLKNQKASGGRLGNDFFNAIKRVKFINKKIQSLYRIMQTSNKEMVRIKDEFLRFEGKIKPLLGNNYNSLDTLKHLDKKIGKSKLSKSNLLHLQTIRLKLKDNKQKLDDFYSPLCDILKTNLTIGKLGSMVMEQKSLQNDKIASILIKEIEERMVFYENKLEKMGKIESLSGASLKKALFFTQEIDKARKILKPSDDKISTPSSPLKQENANARSFGR